MSEFLGAEPGERTESRIVFRPHHDRHAIVILGHQCVRLCRQNLGFRSMPVLKQARHPERRLIAHPDQVGLILAARLRLPFIERISRNEDAGFSVGVREHRLDGGRLGLGVDRLGEFGRIFDPGRGSDPSVPSRSVAAQKPCRTMGTACDGAMLNRGPKSKPSVKPKCTR